MNQHTNILPQLKTTPVTTEKGFMPMQESSIKNIYEESLQHLPIQRKLSIGALDGPLEAEADAMADKVMRMPESNFIQRKCAHCEEEEKAQRKPLASFIQKKEATGNTIAGDAVTNQIQSTKGSGNALPGTTKSFMESRFGANFSNVRIHSDDYAAQLSKELNAQAFTVGNDIYFNEGKYQPESSDGKHLLAHELTHTVQQNSDPDCGIKQKTQQHIVQKKWKINPRTGANPLNKGGQTDQKLLEDAFKEICPHTSRSGNIITLNSGVTPKSRIAGCDCLSVIDGQIGKLWKSDPEIGVEPFGWSQTSLGGGAVFVSVRHPEDPFSWGYWTGTSATHPSETRHIKPFWQTVAHEICGHVAAAARSGGTSVGSRGVGTGHNVAIAGENLVAAEHGVLADEQRGMDINAASGKPMRGHRGESFLEASVMDFAHSSDALPATKTDVMNSVVNTVKTTGTFPEMLIQVEGFAYLNEGGLSIAQSRAANVKGEIISLLTSAGLLTTSAGVSRFSADLATITPGVSYPNTSDIGRVVKIYLFHQKHSAAP